MEDLPGYLLHASFRFPKKELVQINIRMSGEPEDTALVNELALETFRSILIEKFHFKQDAVDKGIARMHEGHSYNCYLSMDENGVYRSGLPARA